MTFWKVSDFKEVNKAWGSYRKLIGKIDIADGNGFIGLFRENCDGRESICVHQATGELVSKLPLCWVSSEKEKQMALDKIFDTLMGF